ncbi:MAG: glycosyltransferase family 2 protein [Polyangiaceae bacterium]
MAIARAHSRWRAISRAELNHKLSTTRLEAQPATLIRPCAGDEPHLAATLRSSLVARELGPHARVVFAIESRSDLAWPTVSRITDELRALGLDARIIETATTALNAKSGQLDVVLSQLTLRSSDELLVFCDSDVELRDGDLIALAEPVLTHLAGCCWAPPFERVAPRDRGDLASEALLGGSLHSFVLLSGLDRAGLVGKLFTLRARTLSKLGGFASMLDVLGEDMELARLLRAHDVSLEVSPRAVRSLACGRSVPAAIERYTRWLQVIRTQRPALLLSYPALFFATPLILIGSLWLAMYDPLLAFSSAAIAIATRLTVALAAREATDRSHVHQDIWVDAILSDLLLAMAFFQALTRSHVLWRGRRLSLSRGRLVPAMTQAARWIATFAVVAGLSIPQAFALPKAGDQGLNAKLEDASGKVTELKQFKGKPI